MSIEGLKGKKVVITGASRGIGMGVAEGFADVGCDLTLIAIDEDVVGVARQMADEYGCDVRGFVCDITDRDALDQVSAEIDNVDVLINNAGLELITPIDDEDAEIEETFRRIVEINIMGTYYVTRRLLPKMPDGGRIIMTASMWGKTAIGEFSAYCASKHANIGFVRSLAKELGPRNISVNAVCPGWVRTIASMRSLSAMARRSDKPENELLDGIVAAQAFPGLMEPRDMAETYLFLASDAARNITGQAITVDRGDLLA